MPDLSLELNASIVSDVLVCPVCGARLHISPDGRSLLCGGAKIHCFDGGGGGYVPLAPRHSGGGDSKEAVRNRTAFLSKGYYQPAAEALCALVAQYIPRGGALMDAGCGEGYYSNRLADCGYRVLGVDLSKFAVDAAAKGAKRTRDGAPSSTVFAVGSVFELPAQDESADGVVNLFAPCAPVEYARVLKSGGYLIVAGAGDDHLMGLKERIYDDPYLNEGRRDLPEGQAHSPDGLVLVEKRTVRFEITVNGREDLLALFSMTPYYWRTSPTGHERLLSSETLTTPVTFDFFVYQKRS